MVQYFITLFCSVNLLFADVYIVSIKVQVKDAQLLNSSLMASKAMRAVSKTPYKHKTILLSKTCKQKDFFECYEDEIIDYLVQEKVIIKAYSQNLSYQNQNFTELIVPPTYLQVDFKDTLAKIALLK